MGRLFFHIHWPAAALAMALAVLAAACTDYNVPGADKPWPRLSDFPERPDAEKMDERRRRLIGKYGDPEDALPKPAEIPDRPPQDAIKVAVVQFPRAGRDLDAASVDILEQVAAYAQQSRASVWLFGYTSRSVELAAGPSAQVAAQSLASDRVRAVALALVRAGVPADTIHLVARGARDPVYLESAKTGEAGNRRVEIYFTK